MQLRGIPSLDHNSTVVSDSKRGGQDATLVEGYESPELIKIERGVAQIPDVFFRGLTKAVSPMTKRLFHQQTRRRGVSFETDVVERTRTAGRSSWITQGVLNPT